MWTLAVTLERRGGRRANRRRRGARRPRGRSRWRPTTRLPSDRAGAKLGNALTAVASQRDGDPTTSPSNNPDARENTVRGTGTSVATT